jgi:hypothetical protein
LVNPKIDSGNSKINDGLSAGTRSHTVSPSPKKNNSLLRSIGRVTAGVGLGKSGYEMQNIFLKRKNSIANGVGAGAGARGNRSSFRVRNKSIGGETIGGWEMPGSRKSVDKNLQTIGLTVQLQ